MRRQVSGAGSRSNRAIAVWTEPAPRSDAYSAGGTGLDPVAMANGANVTSRQIPIAVVTAVADP